MLKMSRLLLGILVVSVMVAPVGEGTVASTNQSQFMKIKVIDERTGRGIPLVQIRTNHLGGVNYFTDSQGIAAIHEPGLMGEEVVLEIRSPGYVHDQDHNPTHKIQLGLVAGESKTIEMKRDFEIGTTPGFSDVVLSRNVAARMYRLTGSGIYRDSWLVGEKTPIEHPLLNANVMIQGGATNAVFRDKLFWFFGPKGAPPDADFRHQVSGATSKIFNQELDPAVGVNLDYFENFAGSNRSVFPSLRGETVAVNSVMVPRTNPSRLYAQFQLTSDGDTFQGLARWDEAEKRFRFVREFPRDLRVKLCPNATRIREDGREWFYFSCPFPVVRVPATPEAVKDSSRYQTFTPVKFNEPWKGKNTELSEDREWAWKRRTATLNHRREFTLRRPFLFGRGQGIHHLTDILTGEPVIGNQGTVFWNEFRGKWVMITNEFIRGGPQEGNVFYAEADSPLGPWVYTRKIAAHSGALNHPHRGPFSFRSVKQHPYFNKNKGETVFFSGVFKKTAPTTSDGVPRYNNNNLMYRLDLTNNRLHLPTPVYVNGDFQTFAGEFRYGTARSRTDTQQTSGLVLFYAYPIDRHDRPETDPLFERHGTGAAVDPVPVWREQRQVNGGSATGLTTEPSTPTQSDTPVFFAWPSDVSLEHPNLTRLQEYKHPSKSTLIYVPEEFAPFFEDQGWNFERTLVRVWSSPRVDPPTNPGAEPVKTCLGSSAVCD